MGPIDKAADGSTRTLRVALLSFLGAVAWTLGARFLLGSSPGLLAAAVAFAAGLVVAAYFAGGERWSVANIVTSIRLGLVSYVAGALFGEVTWMLWSVAVVALMLDGVDGYCARRFGQSSEFGARFDMETDAAFILVLSALVFIHRPTGPWVLALGTVRYAFLGAGWFLPFLKAPLPPSFVRKSVCVVQVLALLAALHPYFPPSWGAVALGTSLAALCASFAKDIVWLRMNHAHARL